ncbi:MAG: zinc ABC transporter substrate-binding protein [Clostridia bacterium]|nr:zinc ABC transporter substrate-binding protein [Clostridia bacterium]
MAKRLLCFILMLALALSALSGCSKGEEEDEKLKIVCTIFPQYDWMRNIIGEIDGVELTLLISNGNDMHSYEPSAADIMKIADCDMIVYLGKDIDGWVSEAIERSGREDVKKVALAECEGVTLRNISSASHTHDHDEHDDHDDHDGHDHGALDEHLWLSLKNATVLTETLCDAICELDPENAQNYRDNAARYILELEDLRLDFEAAVARADGSKRFMLFCDRFPFVYLLEELGIEYSAAFEGCSADVDADFGTVVRLIEEAEEHGVDFVAMTESSDGTLARTVANAIKDREVGLLTLDSMQAVGKKKIESGYSYLSIMRENLRVLSVALGVED